MTNPQAEQSLTEHLTELRQRLFYSMIFIAIGFGVSFYFSDQIVEFAKQPIAPYINGSLKFLGVYDVFVAHMKISLLSGIIISAPFWVYQIWLFVSPGLYKNERIYALLFIFFGSLLFFTGVCFVYYIIYPLAFKFLLTFGGGSAEAMITIDRYFSFLFLTTLVVGLMFELPLVLTILGKLGLIDANFLRSKRRYAIVGLSFLAAVASPPDVASMIMMMLPLTLLYEISILLVAGVGKNNTSGFESDKSGASLD